MEDKIKTMLGALSYNELMTLKRDVDSGALLLQHIVNSKVNELEHEHRKFCANCNKELSLNIDDVYTLVFGDKTIKKKATFCGTDCLNSFINILQDEKLDLMRKELRTNSLDNSSLTNVAEDGFLDKDFTNKFN